MIPATTILITILLSSSSFSVGEEEEEKEFNFIKPNDDAGFFLPYKKLSMSGFDKGGGWDKMKYEPEETKYPQEEKKYEPEEKKYEPEEKKYQPEEKKYEPEEKQASKSSEDLGRDLNIEKEIKMIDDNLRNMEKLVNEKKDIVEEEIKKEIEQETSPPSSQQSSGQSLEDFKSEQAKYEKFPTQPADTRRMFEHPLDPESRRIQELSEEIKFRTKNRIPATELVSACESPVSPCKDSKYRNYDGTCNNLASPLLGSVNSPYRRMLDAAYGPEGSPRGVTSYSPATGYVSDLPSPRTISVAMESLPPSNLTESDTNTHMMMQWGQFVDHDIIGTAKSAFDCCNPDIKNLPLCFSIPIPEEDPFYSQFGKTCLDFTRSATHCTGKQDEQVNTVTAFLDGSVIYGTSEARALKLRGGKKREGGKLIGNTHLPHFLPSKFDLNMKSSPSDKSTDFVAGDDRVETQASLTSVQNLFFNEHNRIAEALAQVWKEKVKDAKELDELVYQETRRLVTAQLQHITFTEWLPSILGSDLTRSLGIKHDQCEYRDKVESGIVNSFAAAAFRFGHSLVQSVFRGVNQPWRLGKFYADSRFAFKDNGHGYVNELEGLAQQPCQKADLSVSEQLTQQLYSNNKTQPGGGHDLVSTNIQRGRDHGIPSYNSFRTKCGLAPLKSFDSAPAEIGSTEWTLIKSVYKSVEEIDLFVGGLAEAPISGAIVGPTLACIIGDQFKLLMDGDRYFYRHNRGQGIHPLGEHCLKEISKRKLSDIICENTDIAELAENVFVQPGPNNQKTSCKDHQKLDLDGIAREHMKDL